MPLVRSAFTLNVVLATALLVGCTEPSATPQRFAQHFVEIRANTFTYNRQTEPSVDVDPQGDLLVAWGSRRQEHGTFGVFAQRFDARGDRLGGELHVNQTERSMQLDPAVAFAANGDAWIVWQSEYQDGDRGAIVARRFGTTDSGDSGPLCKEFIVNQSSAGHQSRPTVAAGESGNVLVVWLSDDEGQTLTMGRVFSSNGEFASDEFRVGESLVGRESAPAIAALNDRGFVVVWARTNDANRPENVYARLFGEDGTPLGAEWVVNDVDGGAHIEPAVDAAASGDFVTTWLVRQQESYAVAYRIFDGSGQPLGPMEIAASGPQWRSGAAVAVAADGRFVIAYNVDTPEDDVGKGPVRPSHRSTPSEIRAQRFSPNGRSVGEWFRVNRFNEGRQALTIAASGRQIVWSRQNRLAFVWAGNTGRDDGSGVALSLVAVEALDEAHAAEPKTTGETSRESLN